MLMAPQTKCFAGIRSHGTMRFGAACFFKIVHYFCEFRCDLQPPSHEWDAKSHCKGTCRNHTGTWTTLLGQTHMPHTGSGQTYTIRSDISISSSHFAYYPVITVQITVQHIKLTFQHPFHWSDLLLCPSSKKHRLSLENNCT